MPDTSLKQKVVKGVVWVTLEKFATQFVGFFVTMILTRILTPTDYGMVAMLGLFVFVSSTLADAGLGRALVQKKDATDLDFNTIFYTSIVLTAIIYAVLFFSAPSIARWYGIPELCWVLRIISSVIIFHSIEGVQQAELNRSLRFDLSFRINLLSSGANMVSGISLAFAGYGVWALVWSQFCAGAVGVIARWYFIAWRPAWMFSFSSLRALWGYGWKLTVSAILDSAYGNLSGLLIGKIYTPADLAMVDRGASMPNFAMSTINQSITRVTFPALAKVQDERIKARECMRKMIRTSTFLVFPLMVGCAVCASSTVPLLFGNQWTGAVPYVWIASFGCALMPFHTINLNCIAAMGRSDIFLTLEVIKKTLGIALIVLFIREGVFAFVLIRSLILGPVSILINAWPNRKLLGYSLGAQVRDVAPTVYASAFMGTIVWGIGKVGINSIITLSLQIIVGVLAYGVFAWALKIEAFNEYWQMVILFFTSISQRVKRG